MDPAPGPVPVLTTFETSRAQTSPWNGILRPAVMLPCAAACATGWVLWVVLHPLIPNTWLNAGLLFVMGADAAAVTAGLLVSLGFNQPRSHRTGLMTGSGLAFLAGVLAGMWPALAGLLGAASGTLLLTTLMDGLWEDNFPPSRSIQEEVARLHREAIGEVSARLTAKRLFDILMSGAALLLFSPIILLIALCIWIEDPGPVLFIKNSVGRAGINFRQLKFRTMIREAEKATGPMLSSETDTRVLRIGRFLRKTALDELPQLINILLGEMSFVGPRPQRTILVHEYLQHIPGYARRHAVAPGLAGLAQVVGSYFMPPEEKLVWDLRYIQKANLAYDVRLVALALLVVFWLRWQKGWDEKIPDRWLD